MKVLSRLQSLFCALPQSCQPLTTLNPSVWRWMPAPLVPVQCCYKMVRGVLHPISYFSAKFKKHQLNYSTIEKETLALLLALQHFHVYVGSTNIPVSVYTDLNPLVFLAQMYNHNQRLMRWALLAQEYNIVIWHKKGSDNTVADALSRQ